MTPSSDYTKLESIASHLYEAYKSLDAAYSDAGSERERLFKILQTIEPTQDKPGEMTDSSVAEGPNEIGLWKIIDYHRSELKDTIGKLDDMLQDIRKLRRWLNEFEKRKTENADGEASDTAVP
jgi:hypothetical protein